MTATKIIIVDDDCALCEQTVEYLSLSGFDVVGVGSAAELYRRLAVEDFAIIVLDVRLPDEDGLSIATHIRKSRNVGIIMATASGETADRILGYEAGADLYLTKPIDFKELVAAVNNLTQRAESENGFMAVRSIELYVEGSQRQTRAPYLQRSVVAGPVCAQPGKRGRSRRSFILFGI